jgi:hypothetical protein
MAAKGKIQKTRVVGSVVTIEYPSLGKAVSIDVASLSDEMKFAGLVHGVKQVLGDAKSGGEPEEKFEMASRIRDGIVNHGIWGVAGQSRDTSPQVIEAVAELLKKSADDIEEMLEDLSDDDRKAKIAKWRAQDSVKLRMMQIAERKLKERAKGSTFEV